MSFTILERRICVSSSRGERKKKREENGSCSQRMIKEWRVVYLDLFKSGWRVPFIQFLDPADPRNTAYQRTPFSRVEISRMFHEYSTRFPLVCRFSRTWQRAGVSQGGKSGELNSFPGSAPLWLTIFLVRVIIKCNVSLNLWVYCEIIEFRWNLKKRKST